jgi:hypothetical protein
MMKETNMTISTDLLLGRIRISDEGEYHPGKFTIELFSYWNRDEPSWGMPAWDERGWSKFMEHFDSYGAAVDAVMNSDWDLRKLV